MVQKTTPDPIRQHVRDALASQKTPLPHAVTAAIDYFEEAVQVLATTTNGKQAVKARQRLEDAIRDAISS